MTSSSSRLQVGVIGCGHIARTVHIPILLRHAQVQLAAVAEPDREAREAAVQRGVGVIGLENYQDLLQLPDLDAVLICLPTALHAEAAVAALSAGKHIYLEKPVAADLSEARPVLEAWERADRVGMIGFNYRYNPLSVEARDRIKAGGLGEIVAVRSVFAAAPHTLPNWKRAVGTGGGALLDLASHHVDLLRFLTGCEVESVSCVTQSRASEDDTAALTMQLSGTILAQTFVSLSAIEEDRVEIYGERGKLSIDRLGAGRLEMTPLRQEAAPWSGKLSQAWGAVAPSRYQIQKRLSIGWEPSYTAALAHFVMAALAKKQGGRAVVSPDLADGYRSLAVIAAAQESAQTGRLALPETVLHENSARQ